MRTIRLRIVRGVTLPGGIDALPDSSHEVEERFGRALLFEGRAIPDPDILAPTGEEPQDDAGPDLDPEPPPAPVSTQDRDPKPINRDPARRRQGPRR
jgi:hypothetical protein